MYNKIDALKSYETLITSDALQREMGGRWIKVYGYEDFDSPTGETFVLVAGGDMMPADYREEHDSIDDVLKSMRGVADLRRWVLDDGE